LLNPGEQLGNTDELLASEVGPQGVILNDETVISVDPAHMQGRNGTCVERGVCPRDVIIDPTGPINLRILEVEQLGAESYLFAELSTGETIVVHQAGQTDVKIGDELCAAVNPNALFVFDKVSGQAWY
jgi:multiple sugar transport system ATP-binding protein